MLASSLWFPQGSAEVPRALRRRVGVLCKGCMKLGPSVFMGRTGGETKAREASGLWSAANQTVSIRCQPQCTVLAPSFISAGLAPNCPVHLVVGGIFFLDPLLLCPKSPLGDAVGLPPACGTVVPRGRGVPAAGEEGSFVCQRLNRRHSSHLS